MGQDRLDNLAIINIERAATNRVLQLQMNEIIDTFGRRENRLLAVLEKHSERHVAAVPAAIIYRPTVETVQ